MNLKFLSTLGKIVLQLGKAAPYAGPIIAAVIPRAAPAVDRATTTIDQIAGAIVNVEAIGQALSLPGTAKLDIATPMVAQLLLQSSMLAGHEIAHPDLFKSGCEKLGSGMADILNSLKTDAA